MLVALRLGVMTPPLRRREVNDSSCAALSAARAAITPSAVISHARRGRGLYWVKRSIELPGGLDKRDLVDLLQGGNAGPDPGQGRFAQKVHAFVVRCPADFRRRPLFQN